MRGENGKSHGLHTAALCGSIRFMMIEWIDHAIRLLKTENAVLCVYQMGTVGAQRAAPKMIAVRICKMA